MNGQETQSADILETKRAQKGAEDTMRIAKAMREMTREEDPSAVLAAIVVLSGDLMAETKVPPKILLEMIRESVIARITHGVLLP